MASTAVQRRRLLLAGFVGILVIAWAMNAIGGTEPRLASKPRASGTPRLTVAPLPPSAVQLTAPGSTFSPDACVAFPPTTAGPANASGAKALVSVHMNAFGLPSEGGALTIWDPDRVFWRANQRLAGLLQTSVVSGFRGAGWPVPDRGTLRDTQNHGTALTAAGAR